MKASKKLTHHFFVIFIITGVVLIQNVYAQSITAPENLLAEPVSQVQINLSWKDSNKNKTYYVVERSTGNPNNFDEVAILPSNASNYSDKTLSANTKYYYRIKAVIRRIFGESVAYSDIADATTFPNPPTQPSNLKATTKSQTEIDISWTDASDNEEGFSLERSEKNTGNFKEIVSLPINATNFNDQDLKSNTTYFYRLRAFNKGGYSAYTSNVSAATIQYPPTLNPIPDPPAINENAETQELTITGISDGGDGGQTLTVTATSDNKELMPNPQIVYTSPNSTAVLRYRTNRNKFGIAVVTVTVKDNGPGNGPISNTVSQSFKVTVNEVNDPPTLNVISNPSGIFENSDVQTINLSGISAGPDEVQDITITATSDNTGLIPHPTVNYTSPNATGTLTYKPEANKWGKATITVTVKDSGPNTPPHQNTFTRTFDVEVLWVNKAPTLNAISDPPPVTSTAGEQSISLSGITAGANDPPQNITITAQTDNPAILQNLAVDYESPQSTATLRYSPIADQIGTAVITVTVKDDGPGTSPHVNSFSRSFTVRITDIPLVAGTNFPEYYTSASGEPIGITVHDNITVNKVELHYRPLNKNDWQKIENIPGNGNEYNIPTPADDAFGPVGMEYFFIVYANETLVEETEIGLTYLKYSGEGLPIQDLKFGGSDSDYQIVSIPLDLANNAIPAVFEDDLGPYNPRYWRLFHHDSDTVVEYPSGFTTIEPGLGYWLIMRGERNLSTGEGTTLKINREEPFNMPLKKGWNQIGNPYNMDVNWDEVLSFNDNPSGLGNLQVFENGSFNESSVLRKLRGGFLFSEEEMNLLIPVVESSSAENGRATNQLSKVKKSGQPNWEVQLSLKSSNNVISSGNFGMADDALDGKDHHDEVALPDFGFIKQANIKFENKEYFYPFFSKDIAASSENHIWEFNVTTNMNSPVLDLIWQQPQMETENLELILYDLTENRIVNMRERQKYSFLATGKNSKFRVYYGDNEFIRENLKPEYLSVNKPFPNPFTEKVTFPFNISKTEKKVHLQITIYDATGKTIAIPINDFYRTGFYEETWDGNNMEGKKLPPGMYIYKLTLSDGQVIEEHKGRLVLN